MIMGDKCKINLEWIPAAYQSFNATEPGATVKPATFPLYNRIKEKGTKQFGIHKPCKQNH
jgi:hypothetical protein